MAEGDSAYVVRLAGSVAALQRPVGRRRRAGQSFQCSHAFLAALEDSGSVGPGTAGSRRR
jgi:hypothetical protein